MGIVIGLLAADKNYGIGKDNTLPWSYNKEDMKFFYKMTKHNPVVMGRNTWDSLPEGSKPLKYRDNYILTRHQQPVGTFKAPTVGVCSLGDIVFVIGGVETYKHYHKETDAYVIVNVGGRYNCDAYFPIPKADEMSVISVDSGNGLLIHLYTKHGLDDNWLRMIVSKIQKIT